MTRHGQYIKKHNGYHAASHRRFVAQLGDIAMRSWTYRRGRRSALRGNVHMPYRVRWMMDTYC